VNLRIRRLGVALVVCYIALFAMLNYIQVFNAEALNERPENIDVIRIDYARNRGTITTADGTVIAESVPVDDEYEYLRTYPTNDLFAAVTGYYSFEFGASGLERTFQEEWWATPPSSSSAASPTSSSATTRSAICGPRCGPTSSSWPRTSSDRVAAPWW
jgi:hypothetical protein